MNESMVLCSATGLPKDPPSELRVFGFGPFSTIKGQFKFTPSDAKEVMKRYQEHGAELCFDYEHFAVDPEKGRAGDGKAAAWYRLELRKDGLYATNIRWTKAALDGIRAKEWRYWSPAFLHTKDRHITELINIALTNIPATHDLEPLVAASRVAKGRHTMTDEKAPVADDAGRDEEEQKAILAEEEEQVADPEDKENTILELRKKIQDLEAQIEEMENQLNSEQEEDQAEEQEQMADDEPEDKPDPEKDELKQKLSMVMTLSRNLTGGKNVDQIIGGLKAIADQRKIKVQTDHSERRVALLDRAVSAGQITPAQRKHFEKKNIDEIIGYLAVTPKAVGAPSKSHRFEQKPTLAMLSAEDKKAARDIGVTEEEFAKIRESEKLGY